MAHTTLYNHNVIITYTEWADNNRSADNPCTIDNLGVCITEAKLIADRNLFLMQAPTVVKPMTFFHASCSGLYVIQLQSTTNSNAAPSYTIVCTTNTNAAVLRTCTRV